jgi:hypothetical protein
LGPSIGKILENLLVLVVRPLPPLRPVAPFLVPPLLRLLILVQEIVFVAEVIFVDVDATKCGGKALLLGGLERGQEELASICRIGLAFLTGEFRNVFSPMLALTQMRLVVDGCIFS